MNFFSKLIIILTVCACHFPTYSRDMEIEIQIHNPDNVTVDSSAKVNVAVGNLEHKTWSKVTGRSSFGARWQKLKTPKSFTLEDKKINYKISKKNKNLIFNLKDSKLQFCNPKGEVDEWKIRELGKWNRIVKTVPLKSVKQDKYILHLQAMPALQVFYFEITDKDVNKELFYTKLEEMVKNYEKFGENFPYILFVTNGLQSRSSENEYFQVRKFLLAKDRVSDFYRYLRDTLDFLAGSESLKKYRLIRNIQLQLFISQTTYSFLQGTDIESKIEILINKNPKLKELNAKKMIQIRFYVDDTSLEAQEELNFNGKPILNGTIFYKDKIILSK